MNTFVLAATAALTTALVAVSAPLPAFASDHSWQVGDNQFHVYYRDLDMNRSTDRATMLARVETAAGKLCATRTSLKVDRDACIADVVNQSMPASPMLRLAMNERNGARLAAR